MKRWAVSCHTLLKGEEVVTVTSQDARCLFFVQLMSTGNFPDTWHVHIPLSRISRLTSFTSGYQWLDEDTLQSLPSAHRNLELVAVTSSRNLWGHTSQHKQFGTWWCYVNTSAHKTDVVITLSFQHLAEKPQRFRCRVPECQLMTGQLEKSSKFVTDWQRAVMDWRVAEHPQHSWLQDALSGLTTSTADAQLTNACSIGI